MKHLFRLGALLALLALVPALTLAAAAPAPSSAIGVIDSDAVRDDSTNKRAADAALQAYQSDRQKVLTELSKGQFLKPEEFKELKDLVLKPVRNARIDELQQLSAKNKAPYQALIEKTKANLTDDEKKRLNELEQAPQVSPQEEEEYYTLFDKGRAKLTDDERAQLKIYDDAQKEVGTVFMGLRKQYSEEIQGEQERLYGLVDEQIKAAIETVAKDKKLGVVLNRNAAAGMGPAIQFVLWGGVDISELVKKQLNDSFKLDSLKPKPQPK